MNQTSQPGLLVLGNILPSAEQRLANSFDLHGIGLAGRESADLGVVGSSIIAIATFGHKPVDATLLDQLPNLKMVGNYGVGYDTVDATLCAERGIVVTNTPDVLTDETADTAVALLLMTAREYSASERYLRDGKWPSGNYPLTRTTLRGRTVGIAGLGRIGKAIGRRLEGFNLKLAYTGRSKQDGIDYSYYPSLLEMAKAVDTLMLVLPGSASTKHSVNAEVLKALGSDGILVNIGRGSVVDEDALIKALHDGTIAAAGLDVFENEPNIRSDFLTAPNIVLLPHVGSGSIATRQMMGDLLVDNIERFFADGRVYTPVTECGTLAKTAERSA